MARTALRIGIPAIALAAAAAAAGARPAEDARDELERRFRDEVKPVVARLCLECHAQGQKTAALTNVSFDRYGDLAAVLADRATWTRVGEMLAKREMPPASKPQPTAEELVRLQEFVRDLGRLADPGAASDPGRVTLRRLNRAEYDNTIRDLLLVSVRPAESFPADDRGYGFDNNADVLSMSPLLAEKLLAAAEKALAAAIVTEDPNKPFTHRVRGAECETSQRGGGGTGDNGVRGLWSNGEVFFRRHLPADAEYVVRASAFADPAGSEPARMALQVDGAEAKVFDVRAVRGKAQVFEHRLRAAAGQRRIGAAFLNDFYNTGDPDPKNRDRNLHVEWVEVEGPFGAGPAALPESHRRIFFVAPGPKLPELEAARQIVARFAARAFRRPVADDEVARYLAPFKAARTPKKEKGEKKAAEPASFVRAVALSLQAVLVSPHFLYRIEEDPPPASPPAVRALGDFELASRLSYFLWSSMPDDALLERARAGGLAAPEALAAEVKRLLADPRSAALVQNFAGQWLELRSLAAATPDVSRFPERGEDLRAAMRRETELCFETILREDRSVLELIEADWTFVNARLAVHYGIEGVEGDDFRRVSTRGTARGGVLTHASVLTVTSNPTRTSPVKRGKWILDQLLGAPLPPPPPGVPQLDEEKAAASARSLREQMERHRTDPNCAACHARLDPLGLALENFDAVGRWRDREEEGDGAPIDARAALPDGTRFDGAAGLKKVLLARKGELVRCLAERLLTYALGRGVEPSDAAAIERIALGCEAGGYKISRLIEGVARSDPFTKRRGRRPGE